MNNQAFANFMSERRFGHKLKIIKDERTPKKA